MARAPLDPARAPRGRLRGLEKDMTLVSTPLQSAIFELEAAAGAAAAAVGEATRAQGARR